MTDWNTRPQPVGPTRWAFPPASDWPDGDIIAIGGDLDPTTVIGAYRRGIFPMIVEAPDPVLAWWSPNPRGILPLDRLRASSSLRRSAKRFEVRVDTCFGDVIAGCADPSRKSGWITGEFVAAYTQRASAAGLPYPKADYQAAAEYAAWQMLEAAAIGAGRIDDKAMAAWLRANPVKTVLGTRMFDGKFNSGPADTKLKQVQDGKWVTVWPPKFRPKGGQFAAL